MPKTDEKPPTLEELTTEQKQSTDPDYIAAVNASIEEGLSEIEAGKGIPADKVWDELNVEN